MYFHTPNPERVTLTDEEREALRYAATPALTPAEARELLHFLGYPKALPVGVPARVTAVAERIAESRAR